MGFNQLHIIINAMVLILSWRRPLVTVEKKMYLVSNEYIYKILEALVKKGMVITYELSLL